MIDIAKARALCDAATKGPWEYDRPMVGNAEADVAEILRNENMEDENAAFIANVRTAYPAALDELESLRAQLASVTAERDALGTRCGQIGGLKSRIAELNVELDRAGSKHDAAVRRADDAEALLREARHALRISRADTPNGEDDRKQAIARIDAHLKENT